MKLEVVLATFGMLSAGEQPDALFLITSIPTLRDTTARLRVTSTRTSYRRKDGIFTNFSSIFSKQIHVVANLYQSQSNLHYTISFFILFLLDHFSCKLKIGNKIVKDPNEVAEDCMTL